MGIDKVIANGIWNCFDLLSSSPNFREMYGISQENLCVDIGGLKGGKETGRGSLCWETVENFRRH